MPSLVYGVAFRLCARSCEEALKGCFLTPGHGYPHTQEGYPHTQESAYGGPRCSC